MQVAGAPKHAVAEMVVLEVANGVRHVVFTAEEPILPHDLAFAHDTRAALDASGRLGTGELPLRVVRPFFVDFNLPVSLTRNDEVSVPVVVHNYTDKPQSVTACLSDRLTPTHCAS